MNAGSLIQNRRSKLANSRYVKGRRFEHAVRKWYEQKGYTVIRSAGSKGKIDLIAWHWKYKIESKENDIVPFYLTGIDDVVKVIQCKIYDSKATKPLRTDVELLKQVAVPASWVRVLAWRVNGESGFKEEIV